MYDSKQLKIIASTQFKNFSIFLVNLKLARKILVTSKNRVIQLQTAISPELFESEKRFIQRSNEEHQGFEINF